MKEKAARKTAPRNRANAEAKEKPIKARRNYSDEEKAGALEVVNLCGGNVAEASRLTGILEETIRVWTRGHCVAEKVFTDFTAKKQSRMTGKMRALADRLADALLDETKIAGAGYKELNAAFGTVFDKLRLIDGQATAITANLTSESLKAEAQIVLKDYLKHLDGDESAALALLREDFPEMASVLVQ